MRGKIRLVLCICLVFLLISCGARSSGLKDGYYSAEAAEFDNHGWKEYVTICVSGGRIILIEYNAFNPSGFIRSWDMDYMRAMDAIGGIYPNAYTRHYSRMFLEKQGVNGIDAITGASHSFPVFIKLAETVLQNAREGNRKTAFVRI